jgi:hypothetical protein
MRTVIPLIVITLAIGANVAVQADNRQPSETQCTQLINSMLQMIEPKNRS